MVKVFLLIKILKTENSVSLETLSHKSWTVETEVMAWWNLVTEVRIGEERVIRMVKPALSS